MSPASVISITTLPPSVSGSSKDIEKTPVSGSSGNSTLIVSPGGNVASTSNSWS